MLDALYRKGNNKTKTNITELCLSDFHYALCETLFDSSIDVAYPFLHLTWTKIDKRTIRGVH